MDISKLTEEQKVGLVNNRWASSEKLWDVLRKTYDQNTAIYGNNATWVNNIAHKRPRVQANRIYVDMESVINALIANPATINFTPSREGKESQDLARKLENFFRKRYNDLNVKEDLRMALRNLYFSRLLVLKPFWNPKINDFDVRAIDPRKIRVAKHARKEQDSEFAIEEVEDTLSAVIARFPGAKEKILAKYGFEDEAELYVRNPEIKYQEAWINDYVIFKHDDVILDTILNPYWDWDGIWVTRDEQDRLKQSSGGERRGILLDAKVAQGQRSGEMEALKANEDHSQDLPYESYYYNYFDQPRKPYIFATILNNENSPIGRTDMITLASSLQQGIDKRKQDIDENCELVNGVVKVDSQVMDKSDAQQMRFEAKGIIWGKGVVDGVSRDTGEPLPDMVFRDMLDSRSEIDQIMAATDAFRGIREGSETKAGRLALIQQSYLRLNELIQVVDWVSGELFGWFYQLAKTRYTETHYAKWLGKQESTEIIDLIQDDFESGSEVVVIPGKSLPQDSQFQFEQAQNDVANGYISPVDYLEIANYTNPKDLSRNAVLYKQNPAEAVGLGMDQMPVPFQPGQPTPQQAAEAQQAQQALEPQAPVTE